MKNILFLVDYYLPEASPNGICCSNIIEELKKNGCNCYVLCYTRKKEEKLEKIDDVLIYRIIEKKKKNNFFKKIISYAKWVMPFCYEPVYKENYKIKKLYKCSKKIIKEYGIDTIICSHLPVETIIVGSRLKKQFPNTYICAYMLDAFSGNFLPRFLPSKVTLAKKIKWENNCLKKLDNSYIMESCKNHHKKYSIKKTWYRKAIYTDIPSLILSDKISYIEDRKKIKILYVGSIDQYVRDPRAIIEILLKLSDENIECEFVGNISCPDAFEILKKTLGKKIKFTNHIPHQAVLKKIKEADVMLNIGNLTTNMVPSKIFEYISFKKTIISTYVIDNEPSTQYLKKYPKALIIDGRKLNELSKEDIINFIKNNINKDISDREIKKIFYKNTPEFFVKKLMFNFNNWRKK